MRFLIVATAIFACAAAAPSALLANGILAYGAVPVAHSIISPVNSGDLQAAAIDAQVEAVDAVREINDQAAEIQGRALNAAEDHAWQAVNAAQVAAAQVDGAAAAVSPVAARAVVGNAPVVVSSGLPVSAVSYSVPSVPSVVSPLAYSVPSVRSVVSPLAYSVPLVPGVAGVESKSVSVQSLSQVHPSPILSYAILA